MHMVLIYEAQTILLSLKISRVEIHGYVLIYHKFEEN